MADRRSDVRFVGSINGCYTLSSRRGTADNAGAQVFACRVLAISATSVAVTAPVLGAVDERLSAKLDDIGIVAGRITRLIPDGFVFEIAASPEERAKLSARILWLKHRRLNAGPDRREHKRILPRDARSTLTLPDGQVFKCVLIDISRSGVAVSADIVPRPAMQVVVGKVPGRIVRPLEVGFAVEFDEVQPLDHFEALLAVHDQPPTLTSAAEGLSA